MNNSRSKLRPTSIDIHIDMRERIVQILNLALLDSIDLFSQLKQAHWNLRGPSFIALHALFDEIAEKIEEGADMVAERSVQLGGVALGTVREASSNSRLPEYPAEILKDMDHVKAVANSLSIFGKVVREAIEESARLGDAGTSDLFTEISREVDKQLWFVEAHLPVESN